MLRRFGSFSVELPRRAQDTGAGTGLLVPARGGEERGAHGGAGRDPSPPLPVELPEMPTAASGGSPAGGSPAYPTAVPAGVTAGVVMDLVLPEVRRVRPLGISPYTPLRHPGDLSVIALPLSDDLTPAEVKMASYLQAAALEAIRDTDLDRLAQLMPDHDKIAQMELDLAKANTASVEELKEIEIELDFYDHLQEVLREYPKNIFDFTAQIKKFIESDKKQNPGKIKRPNKAVLIFSSIVAYVKASAVQEYQRLLSLEEALSDDERSAQLQGFSIELDALLSKEITFPAYSLILWKGGLNRFDRALSRGRKLEIEAELKILRAKRALEGISPAEALKLDEEIEWHTAALTALNDYALTRHHLESMPAQLESLTLESNSAEHSAAEKRELHRKIILYTALKDVLQSRMNTVRALLRPPLQNERWSTPLNVKELKESLDGLVDASIESAVQNYRIYCESQGKVLSSELQWITIDRGNLGPLGLEFKLKIGERLLPARRWLSSLGLTESSSAAATQAVIEKALRRVDQEFKRLQERKAEIIDKLTEKSAPLREAEAEKVEAYGLRLRLALGEQYTKYLEDKSADPSISPESALMRYHPGVSEKQAKIAVYEGLSPNAANKEREALVFELMRTPMSHETRMSFLQFLVVRGSSMMVIDAHRQSPGALLTHDSDMLAYISDVRFLQESNLPFYRRVLDLAEGMSSSLDRYQINQRTRMQSILYRLFMHNEETLMKREAEKEAYREIVIEIKARRYQVEALIKQAMEIYEAAYLGPRGGSTLHAATKSQLTLFRGDRDIGRILEKVPDKRAEYSAQAHNELARVYASKDADIVELKKELRELKALLMETVRGKTLEAAAPTDAVRSGGGAAAAAAASAPKGPGLS